MAPIPLPSISHILDDISSISKIRPRDFTSSIFKRQSQNVVAVPLAYDEQTTQPGVVAGIVLGSVAGVLVLFYLIYQCFNLGGKRGQTVVEEDITVHHKSRASRSPRRVRSQSRSEVIEVRSPPRRERSRRETSRRRDTIIIEESRRSAPPPEPEPMDDDIVEVIEEHSPPPDTRRHSSRRERVSGYRTVDPEQFGGGDAPRRKVRR